MWGHVSVLPGHRLSKSLRKALFEVASLHLFFCPPYLANLALHP